MKLRKMFPSDRVVQRMIKEEMQANPECPEDFMKDEPVKPVLDKRAAQERVTRFENEMTQEARAFIEASKKKRNDDVEEVVVMKQTLSDLYAKMRVKYRDVILSSYNMTNGAEFSMD